MCLFTVRTLPNASRQCSYQGEKSRLMEYRFLRHDVSLANVQLLALKNNKLRNK